MRAKRAPNCTLCEDTGFILYAARPDGTITKLRRVYACDLCETGRARNMPSRDRDGREHPGSAVRLFSKDQAKYGWKAVPTSVGAMAMVWAHYAERGMEVPEGLPPWNTIRGDAERSDCQKLQPVGGLVPGQGMAESDDNPKDCHEVSKAL